MAWRGIHINQSARIGLRLNQLSVSQNDAEVTIPIEDIAFLVLDTPQNTITGAAMAALADAGVVVVQSDAKHHPTMMALPFHGHHKAAEIAHMQIETSAPFKKRAWQKIIQAKLENQAAHLIALGRDAGSLPSMVTRVKSGDVQNLEAQGARIYWGKLFDGFRRANGEDLRNAMLNYGYAIVRANIARAITASGLIPAFGLFHNSVTNAFNLADDLIEPFRPSIDALACRLFDNTKDETSDLTLEHRRALVAVMNEPIKLGVETVTILASTELCVQSLVRAMKAKDPALIRLPKFVVYTQELSAA